MTNLEIIRAVEGHCHDGLLYASKQVVGPLTRLGYVEKCLETILWECGRRRAETNAEDEIVLLDPKDAHHPQSPYWGSMVSPVAQRLPAE